MLPISGDIAVNKLSRSTTSILKSSQMMGSYMDFQNEDKVRALRPFGAIRPVFS